MIISIVIKLAFGDIFLRYIFAPHAARDRRSPAGNDQVYAAAGHFLAALKMVYPGKVDQTQVITFSDAMRRSHVRDSSWCQFIFRLEGFVMGL
jgi:hypothetical protein